MRLPTTIHLARLGQEEFKVIRPARPLDGASLADLDRVLEFRLTPDAAQVVGGMWSLAVTSPRALIHMPLDGLDLVLVHHSRQFAPSRWKELRGRLGAGRPRTVTVRDSRVPVDRHRGKRDLLHEHVHAGTVFLTGSAKVFGATAGRFFDLAHADCTELHPGDGVLGAARPVHIARPGH